MTTTYNLLFFLAWYSLVKKILVYIQLRIPVSLVFPAWTKLIRERFGKKVWKKKRCSYLKGVNKVGEHQIKLDPRSYCKIK